MDVHDGSAEVRDDSVDAHHGVVAVHARAVKGERGAGEGRAGVAEIRQQLDGGEKSKRAPDSDAALMGGMVAVARRIAKTFLEKN